MPEKKVATMISFISLQKRALEVEESSARSKAIVVEAKRLAEELEHHGPDKSGFV
jgi:hypothetical protein